MTTNASPARPAKRNQLNSTPRWAQTLFVAAGMFGLLHLTGASAQTIGTAPTAPASGVVADPALASDNVPEPQAQDISQLDVEAAAAIGACWDVPSRWTGKSGGKVTDVLNLIVCLGPNASWTRVFEQLAALPGRRFDRVFPLPDYVAPWRRVYHPVSLPFFSGSRCINPVTVNVNFYGDQFQDFSAREGGCNFVSSFGRVRGDGGFNHFRAWRQRGSGAWFIGASTEEFCISVFPQQGASHCIVSYNDGRNLLVGNLAAAARKGGWRFQNYRFRAYAPGSIEQLDRRRTPYDGYVNLVLIGF